MNSETLASMLSGIGSDVSLFQSDKKSNKTDSGDFMDLLKQRLASDSGVNAATSSTGQQSSGQKNKTEFNPLFSMAAPTQFARPKSDIQEQQEDIRDAASAKKSEQRKSAVVEKEAKTTEKSDCTECSQSDEKVEDSQASDDTVETAATSPDANERLEELLAEFSPEDQAAMISALQRLSPEDLQNLCESPEEFKDKLIELIKAMPESAEQQDLLSMIESPEFQKLLDFLAESKTALMQDQPAEPALEKVNTDATEVNVGNLAPQILANSDAAPIENMDATASDVNSESTGLSTQEPKSENGEKESLRADQHEKGERNDTEQVAAIDTSKEIEGESLREEFKRVNEETSEPQPEVETAGNNVEEASSDNKSANVQTTHVTSATDAKTSVEDSARKFMALFGEKSGTSNNDKSGHVYGANSDGIKRPTMTDNSTGNSSMGNGFSSQSGSSANTPSAAKASAPAPAANVIFSEMLEKAEFLKTQNGSKVLNLELSPDQLGKIEMELTSKDGTVSARISAESAMAKAKIDELAPQIKEQLISQGVNLSEITVDISSKNPDEGNSNQMYGRKNKSSRITASSSTDADAIIRKNILPNLRRAALNIKSVDVTV